MTAEGSEDDGRGSAGIVTAEGARGDCDGGEGGRERMTERDWFPSPVNRVGII